MVSTAVEAVFLVGSNLAFLVPFIAALRAGLYPEAVAFMRMLVVSALYHVVDTISGVDLGLDYGVWQRLDFFNAFIMILLATFVVVLPTDQGQEPARRNRNHVIKSCVYYGAETIALALVLQDASTPFVVLALALVGLLMVIFVYVFDREALQMDFYDLVASQVLIMLGIVAYASCGSGGCYYALHSIWHILVSLGLFLVIESRDSEWNALNKLTCGMCCKPAQDLEPQSSEVVA